MMKHLGRIVKFLAEAKESMSQEEFDAFVATNAAISLGVIHGKEGKQFHDDFLKGAVANPLIIKLEKGVKH